MVRKPGVEIVMHVAVPSSLECCHRADGEPAESGPRPIRGASISEAQSGGALPPRPRGRSQGAPAGHGTRDRPPGSLPSSRQWRAPLQPRVWARLQVWPGAREGRLGAGTEHPGPRGSGTRAVTRLPRHLWPPVRDQAGRAWRRLPSGGRAGTRATGQGTTVPRGRPRPPPRLAVPRPGSQDTISPRGSPRPSGL